MPSMLLLDILGMMAYFLRLLIFCILAIILAKKGKPWAILSVGVAIELLAFYGAEYAHRVGGLKGSRPSEWIVFIIIVAVTALIIKWRRR